MTTEEAIMNLEHLKLSEHMKGMYSQIMSIQLGAEALKLYQEQKANGWHAPAYKLPGETVD